MKEWLKPGQKVVAIADLWVAEKDGPKIALPVKGQIYTIEQVAVGSGDRVGLLLKEFPAVVVDEATGKKRFEVWDHESFLPVNDDSDKVDIMKVMKRVVSKGIGVRTVMTPTRVEKKKPTDITIFQKILEHAVEMVEKEKAKGGKDPGDLSSAQ
jgi:hypothetical protein